MPTCWIQLKSMGHLRGLFRLGRAVKVCHCTGGPFGVLEDWRVTKSVFLCCLAALVLLAGCGPAGTGAGKAISGATTRAGIDKAVAIMPVIDARARKAALAALPEDERRRHCQEFSVYSATLSEEARITGPVRRQRSNVQLAGNAILETVEGWYAGHHRASEYIRQTLEEGARIGAFTKIKPYSPAEYPGYNPMNEPIFQIGNFLLALAHGYAVLKADYPEDAELLAAVRKWGDRLFELSSNASDTFGGRTKGVDRRFLIAQGWAHWGNITGNHEALAAAYRYFTRGMSVVGRGGKDRIWRYVFPSRLLYYANMTYGAAATTAYALSRSGAGDVYEVSPGGGTLVEGMAWLTKSMFEARPADLMRRRDKGSRSLGWMEIFVREFPDNPAAKDMDTWLSAVPTPHYVNMSGGPTTCLYRQIQPQS